MHSRNLDIKTCRNSLTDSSLSRCPCRLVWISWPGLAGKLRQATVPLKFGRGTRVSRQPGFNALTQRVVDQAIHVA
jgi:hypothetical protein